MSGAPSRGVATAVTFEGVLQVARQLTPEDQARLIEELAEELEDQDAVRAYDAAKAALEAGADEIIPLEEAIRAYETQHGVRIERPG